MKYDPFYKQIIGGLNGDLDADLFEECAVDLIRRHDGYFAVPILGGQDGGMDGAVADGEGQPYPIIVTTGTNVIGNLTSSLKRYIGDGGHRRKCIVATSQSLTARRRKNLLERASKFEFSIIQILDRSAMAARLYRDPKWCKELLQLNGIPSPLSVIPKTVRRLIDHELVGRETVIEWLRNSEGDRLLIGEPGAGKTSILYQLTKDEEFGALFVIDTNSKEIANAIREQQPKLLILDDAHKDTEFIAEIVHLRDSLRADFSLIASCWHGARQEVESALGIPKENIRELDRLTRDQMVQVIAAAGIQGVNWLVNEIVTQAAGLAGLAVTLAYSALHNGVEGIRTADALLDQVLSIFDQRPDNNAREILGCFSLGGNSGMHKECVTDALGITPLDLTRILVELAAGGIIAEVPNRADHIKVRPDGLRHALIREVFFAGSSSLSRSVFDSLVKVTPNPVETALELISAKARGGNIPRDIIEDYISTQAQKMWHDRQRKLAEQTEAWREFMSVPYTKWLEYNKIDTIYHNYAWLGRAEATWVVENTHVRTSRMARPLLRYIPLRAIPMLLNETIGDDRELHSSTDHPLRLLQDWIKSAYPGTENAIRRRTTLLQASKKWLVDGNEPHVGYRAMLYAMIPEFEKHESTPSGDGITIYRGCLTADELNNLKPHWTQIIDCLDKVDVPDWHLIVNTVREWALPLDCPSAESQEVTRSFARQMISDLRKAASDRPGVLRRLKELAQRVYPDIEFESGGAMEILYPIERWSVDIGRSMKTWQRRADELADQWVAKDPLKVAAQLEEIEREMNNGEGTWPNLTPYLCRRLAEKAIDPLQWFHILRVASLQTYAVIPFLEIAIERNLDGWEQALKKSFETERLRAGALALALSDENMPDAFVSHALIAAGSFPNVIENLVYTNRLPWTVIKKLLRNDDKALVGQLSILLWQCRKNNPIPDELRESWEEAIVEHAQQERAEKGYWLKELFKTDPKLGQKWLVHKFQRDKFERFVTKDIISIIASGLCTEDRNRLLTLVPDFGLWRTSVIELVGDSHELFAFLLANYGDSHYVLLPLSRARVDTVWIAFAKLAFGHGFSAADIASFAFSDDMSWSGELSKVLEGQRDQFSPYMDDDDDVVRQIARAGYKRLQAEYENQLKREHDEDVFGRDL